MSSYIRYEAWLFLLSAGTGAGILLCYDLLTVFRQIFAHSWIWVAVEDIVFWLCTGLMLFAEIYRVNQGSIRSYLFLGNILGAVFCHLTISPLFRKCLWIFLGMPVCFVKKMIKRLLFPCKRCKIFLYNFVDSKVFWGKLRNMQLKRGKRVEKIKKKGKQKENSE